MGPIAWITQVMGACFFHLFRPSILENKISMLSDVTGATKSVNLNVPWNVNTFDYINGSLILLMIITQVSAWAILKIPRVLPQGAV